MEDDLENLLKRMVAGDVDAFWSLCSRIGPSIGSRIARSICAKYRTNLDIEDIMSDAYSKAWNNRSTLKSSQIATFRAWLFTIADRIRIDAQRALDRNKRGGEIARSSMGHSTMARVLFAEVTSPSAHLRYKDNRQLLGRALRSIRPDYRRVLILVDLWEYSFAKAAHILRRSTDATAMLHKRAITNLEHVMRSTLDSSGGLPRHSPH